MKMEKGQKTTGLIGVGWGLPFTNTVMHCLIGYMGGEHVLCPDRFVSPW